MPHERGVNRLRDEYPNDDEFQKRLFGLGMGLDLVTSGRRSLYGDGRGGCIRQARSSSYIQPNHSGLGIA